MKNMDTNNELNKEIEELSEFVNEVQIAAENKELFDVPFTIKYQLADEISSTYDVYEESNLEGISG